MHKAPIVESKQIEHVLNERLILEEAAGHPFCVRLIGAYQDRASLHLLQVGAGAQAHVSSPSCSAPAGSQPAAMQGPQGGRLRC
jgi:hypothetical protein